MIRVRTVDYALDARKAVEGCARAGVQLLETPGLNSTPYDVAEAREPNKLRLPNVRSMPDYRAGNRIVTGDPAALSLRPAGCHAEISARTQRDSASAEIENRIEFGKPLDAAEIPDLDCVLDERCRRARGTSCRSKFTDCGSSWYLWSSHRTRIASVAF